MVYHHAGAGTANKATTTTSLPHLHDDVVAEILLRLPSASVLRCRAVCRAWRDISSGPGFVAAHARRRPMELIVQRHGSNGVLDTIPLGLGLGRRATLADDDEAHHRRCLHPGYPSYCGGSEDENVPGGLFKSGYSLVGSCADGGLLLFERFIHGHVSLFLVCSPASRQWAIVPLHSRRITWPCALYVHGPSGEHRLLMLTNDDERWGWGRWASHYVRSLEAAETRRLRAPPVTGVHRWDPMISLHCPLEHRGRIHWLHHPEAKATGTVLAFDTVAETFRRMSRPPLSSLKNENGDDDDLSLCLLEMGGKVAVAAMAGGSMDVWVLEDYDDDGSWARRHRVHSLPSPFLGTRWVISINANNAAGGQGQQHRNNDDDGDAIVLLQDDMSCSVGLYDLANKRLLKQIQLPSDPREEGEIFYNTHLNALLFRDSIKRHSFFDLHTSILQSSHSSEFSSFLKSLVCRFVV